MPFASSCQNATFDVRNLDRLEPENAFWKRLQASANCPRPSNQVGSPSLRAASMRQRRLGPACMVDWQDSEAGQVSGGKRLGPVLCLSTFQTSRCMRCQCWRSRSKSRTRFLQATHYNSVFRIQTWQLKYKSGGSIDADRLC